MRARRRLLDATMLRHADVTDGYEAFAAMPLLRHAAIDTPFRVFRRCHADARLRYDVTWSATLPLPALFSLDAAGGATLTPPDDAAARYDMQSWRYGSSRATARAACGA